MIYNLAITYNPINSAIDNFSLPNLETDSDSQEIRKSCLPFQGPSVKHILRNKQFYEERI